MKSLGHYIQYIHISIIHGFPTDVYHNVMHMVFNASMMHKYQCAELSKDVYKVYIQ